MAGLALSSSTVAKVVADAQEKTKQRNYHDQIEAAVNAPTSLCIKESQLDKNSVKFDSRHVGKVCHAMLRCTCVYCGVGVLLQVMGEGVCGVAVLYPSRSRRALLSVLHSLQSEVLLECCSGSELNLCLTWLMGDASMLWHRVTRCMRTMYLRVLSAVHH